MTKKIQLGFAQETYFFFIIFSLFSRFALNLFAFFSQFSSRSPPQTKRRKTASKMQLLSNSRLAGEISMCLLNNGHHPIKYAFEVAGFRVFRFLPADRHGRHPIKYAF